MTIKKHLATAAALSLVTTIIFSTDSNAVNALSQIKRIVAAVESRQPAVVVSTDTSIDEAKAYKLQQQWVSDFLEGRRSEGYKAGLTSAAGQQRFGVDGPVAGVLLPGSRIEAAEDNVLSRNDYHNLMFEAELGFVAGNVIDSPVENIEALKAFFDAVVLAVEFPDLSFPQGESFTGIDIIANNVVANKLLVGKPLATSVDINALPVTIKKDDEVLLEAQSNAVMGDQWQALLWLVNHTIEQGWTIKPRQVLITGAIGRMLPAQTGAYSVNFGESGQIDFRIE